MNKSFFTVAIIVVVLLALGAAVFYRDSLRAMFGSSQEPAATTTPQDTLPVWERYASSTFSIDYPPGYQVNSSFSNTEFPQKPIAGVSFTVASDVATGTNLSGDSRVSVESLPRAKNCTGDIYINQDVKAVEVTENGTTYSVASSSDAGAGNRYEQWVYALKGSSPCSAVRYFIHTTELANYPEGTVRAYDREALLGNFDQMRKSLTIGAHASTTPQ